MILPLPCCAGRRPRPRWRDWPACRLKQEENFGGLVRTFYICNRIGFPQPVLPVRESKGKRVRIPYSSRCCMLLRLWGGIVGRLSLTTGPAGSGRCRLRGESEDLPVPAPAHPACGEREGAKQGLFRMPCHYARSAARRVRMRPQAYYTCMRRCRTQGPERCCGIC